jgi:hypothetical protein
MLDIDAEDPVGVLMVAFEVEFILHDQNDEQRAGDADRKTGDIDEGITFLPAQVTKGDS